MGLNWKHKLNSNFHIFIIVISFFFSSFFVQIHSKSLLERILIPNKNIIKIIKNNSTLNSKEETDISNFTFIRKLDNFTNDNDV